MKSLLFVVVLLSLVGCADEYVCTTCIDDINHEFEDLVENDSTIILTPND